MITIMSSGTGNDTFICFPQTSHSNSVLMFLSYVAENGLIESTRRRCTSSACLPFKLGIGSWIYTTEFSVFLSTCLASNNHASSICSNLSGDWRNQQLCVSPYVFYFLMPFVLTVNFNIQNVYTHLVLYRPSWQLLATNETKTHMALVPKV